ncbi:MAG: DUF6438 domain-containing protein [Planctomycetes bacterium]|nr:DUF6438 domain-containing protein [Planctomycetota bacterium]
MADGKGEMMYSESKESQALAFLVLFLLVLAGCGREASPLDPEISITEYSLADFELLTLERTGCYGFCPTYQVTVYVDGLVVYQGYENVSVLGERRGQIDKAGIEELLALCAELDFFGLAAEYRYIEDEEGSRRTVADQPSRITTLRLGGHGHQVENYFGGPEALRALEDRIDDLSGVAEWKKRRE